MTLQCHSKGDKRFSALYAKVTMRGITCSIEQAYQSSKRLADGSVAGKGKRPDYVVEPFTNVQLPVSELTNLYTGLWVMYFTQHPELLEYAKKFDNFEDIFRGKSINCQADVIAACVADFDTVKNFLKKTAWYACYTK